MNAATARSASPAAILQRFDAELTAQRRMYLHAVRVGDQAWATTLAQGMDTMLEYRWKFTHGDWPPRRDDSP